MKNILFITLFVVQFSNIWGQNFCSHTINEERVKEVQKSFNQHFNKNYSGQIPMIRLVLHNVRRSDGTGGNSWTDIRNIVEGLPDFYNPHDICFTVISENNIDDDTYFEITQYRGNPIWEELITVDRVSNAINIYFVSDANQGGRATGMLSTVDNFPTITLSNTAATTISTFNSAILSHEIGHCLGLFHTHEIVNGVEEIPRTGNTANCTTAGDLLCDTPADNNLNISTANIDNETSCRYIGTATLNGFSYNPDTRNVMSYTFPNCMLSFTQEQGNRMRNFILNTTLLDNFVIRKNRIVEGTIFATNRYFGVEGTITTSAEHIYPDVVYEAGVSVSMQPGFSINAANGGTVKARIGSYDCLDPLIRNDAKIGNINDDEISNIHGVAFIKNGQSSTEEKNPKVFNKPLSISPNPFIDAFNLEFELGKSETVSLVLHDALGRVVRTVLMNDTLPQGYHQYKINGDDLEKGLYYVTLKSSQGIQTIKIIKQ